MDLQKIATYSSAAAVVGTGAIDGGGQVIDNINDGPAWRQEAQIEQIRHVVAEEVFIQLKNAWPETSGPVKGTILKQ